MNGGITGGSDAHWYLVALPQDLPAWGISYLDGREYPIVEEVQVQSNQLGMGWRAYIDMGVVAINPKAALRSAGSGGAGSGSS